MRRSGLCDNKALYLTVAGSFNPVRIQESDYIRVGQA